MYKPLRLTKKTAQELINRICPRLNITREPGFWGSPPTPDVAIFRAKTSSDGLDICCENDWDAKNGRIRLTISDGGDRITQFYHPDTLKRDYDAEQREKNYEWTETRQEWVNQMSKEHAHKLVDKYWEE